MPTAVDNNFKHKFQFKQFFLDDSHCAMKIGTDGTLIGAWAGAQLTAPHTISDIGAGCGIVGLMLAQRFPASGVYFIENNKDAVIDLEQNIKSSPWPDRCHIEDCDFRQCACSSIDLIVSNPPFFSNGELAPDPDRAAARHADALSPVALISFAAKRLSKQGLLAMIFPAECLDALRFEASLQGLHPLRICTVTTVPGKPPRRVMAEFGRTAGQCLEETLALRDSQGKYTAQYCNLTSTFHNFL